MNVQKWVGMFWKTLFIGGIAGLITSLFVKTDEYLAVIKPLDVMELVSLVIFFIGLGLVFSVVSQTGFFAYLFINQFGLGLFRTFWPTVQVLLILFVAFDLVYFPYKETNGEVSVLWFMLMSMVIVGYGYIIAKIKEKQTNRRAFIPALFLMVVMTTIEWVPGLRTSGTDYAWLMIIPLMACNTYQLLILHRLTEDSKRESGRKDKGEKKISKKNNPSKMGLANHNR